MELPEGSEYVALGSSYAAGPGLHDRVPGSPIIAGRSRNNYAHLLADRLSLRLNDVTFSGATVAQIIGRDRGAAPSPQLDAVTEETRLVTLTGGGNDVGYIGYLAAASRPPLLRAITRGNRRLSELAMPLEFDRRIGQLADDLMSLFESIGARAPKATIAITDYLALLPEDPAVSTAPISADHARVGRKYWANVNLTLRQAAARARVVFADVSTASASHNAWSGSPWTERFVLIGGTAAPYHPNAIGMTAVADALERALKAA